MKLKTFQIWKIKIVKNMKKITGKVSDARPILQHIYYNDNTIVATDSHRLLQINKSIIKLMFYIMQKLERMRKAFNNTQKQE